MHGPYNMYVYECMHALCSPDSALYVDQGLIVQWSRICLSKRMDSVLLLFLIHPQCRKVIVHVIYFRQPNSFLWRSIRHFRILVISFIPTSLFVFCTYHHNGGSVWSTICVHQLFEVYLPRSGSPTLHRSKLMIFILLIPFERISCRGLFSTSGS